MEKKALWRLSNMEVKRLIVSISGASGAIYGIRLLEILKELEHIETHLVITEAGKRTIGMETKYKIKDVETLADKNYDNDDIGAPIASGSFQTDGMVVAPCSIKSLSGIAISSNNNLLLRAADVTLKERRRLVIMPRETPLHLGHLRLMMQVTENGAILLPPMPAFYHQPTSIDEIIDHTLQRCLDLLKITTPKGLSERWE
jgi:4-hydroxy-3-polyprenylbenzoate decarboxylase